MNLEMEGMKEQLAKLTEIRNNTIINEEKRIVELIREYSEHVTTKIEVTVDLSKQEVIGELQQQIQELRETTARIPKLAGQIAKLEEAMPPLAEKVDNLELISVGIQHDLTVVTGAVNKLEKKRANVSTSDKLEKISKSFQTSLEYIKKTVMTISSSTTNRIPNKQENTNNNNIIEQREKRNKQTQEDEMTDEDDVVIGQPLKFP
jgi:hypothetical protein